MSSIIDRFVRRLEKIGVKVELAGNIPWVYIRKVNDKPITEKFYGEHGFTAFFTAVRVDSKDRFTDRREVFKKIRETLENH